MNNICTDMINLFVCSGLEKLTKEQIIRFGLHYESDFFFLLYQSTMRVEEYKRCLHIAV